MCIRDRHFGENNLPKRIISVKRESLTYRIGTLSKYLFHLDYMFPLAFHFLYPIKSLLVNDRLMSILYQVHIQLPIVFDLLSGQEIRRIAFLH